MELGVSPHIDEVVRECLEATLINVNFNLHKAIDTYEQNYALGLKMHKILPGLPYEEPEFPHEYGLSFMRDYIWFNEDYMAMEGGWSFPGEI